MTESTRIEDCENYSEQLPAYLDYILHGIPFSGQENVEDHLVLCSTCTREYTDLLGVVLRIWLEPLLDQIMEGEPGPENLGLYIEHNSHWFEISTLLAEKRGSAEALSHLGILYELKDDNEQAVSFHLEALEKAENLDYPSYVQVLSASALGRIYTKQGQWGNVLRYLKISCLASARLKDEYALARNFIETGDYFSRSLSYNNLYRAINIYKSAVEISEQVGYTNCRETAKRRIGKLKTELGEFINKLAENYIKLVYKKEVPSINQFTSRIAAKLIDDMPGFSEASKMHSLFIDKSFSGGTYKKLLAFLDTVLDYSPALDSFRAGRESFLGPLLSKKVLVELIKEVHDLGLSQYEAEDLARFLNIVLTCEILDNQDMGN